jgi:hypothetical protein
MSERKSMSNIQKDKISDGLLLTELKKQMLTVQNQIKNLENGQSAITYLPTKLDNLKQTRHVLKLRNKKNPQPDDTFRLLAIDIEIGKILLMIDGVL